MRITQRRGVVTFAALALLAPATAITSGASAAPSPDMTEPDTTEPATAAPAATLEFTDCDDGFECATLTVPRNYDEPDGATIELSVIRKRATNTTERIGALLTNPGGPGGSGVDFVRAVADADGSFAALNERFDIVSWDPRGTKGSSPVNCFTDPELDDQVTDGIAFPTGLDRDAVVQNNRDFIEACLNNNDPAVLSSISTENTARDMDALRVALGEEQISYLGYSYGTYLGATYAALYPEKIRAFVLDGAVDPAQYATNPIGGSITQAQGFETALDRYFDDFCAAGCQFQGGKPAWRALAEQLDAEPLATGLDPTRPVNGTVLLNATAISMYVRQIWPVLDQALAEAAAGDARRLQLLGDIAIGRNDDGSYDPGQGAFPAILSIDSSWPSDIFIQDLLGLIYPQVSPSFGPSTFWASLAGGYASFEWPVEADTRYEGPFRYQRGRTPILVIGNTFDPATPYSGSVAMARQLRNARLLTLNGDGHTAYGGNSTCIDDQVDAFFFDLTLPPRGATCDYDPDQLPPPSPPAAEEVAAAQSTAPAMASLARWSGAIQLR
jgi:pimeloyl-ACP methyl ester carboxylesterase